MAEPGKCYSMARIKLKQADIFKIRWLYIQPTQWESYNDTLFNFFNFTKRDSSSFEMLRERIKTKAAIVHYRKENGLLVFNRAFIKALGLKRH